MKNLLDQLQNLEKSLRAGIILLLDYDGTLVPIAKRPELAVVTREVKELLRSLTERFKVGIISGRSLPEVKKLIGLNGIYYVGNHGLEIDGPGAKFTRPEAENVRPTINKICRRLRKDLGGIKGVIVEDKGLTSSIHYRLVEKGELGELKNIFYDVINPHVNSGEIRVTRGKKVFEIRPNIDWGKGKAVLWIIKAIDPKENLTPIYIGDDKTDEDAFLALKKRGITVLVSGKSKRSNAKFFLRNVDEVKEFLEKILKN